MYKSGKENRGSFCSLLHFCISGCGLKSPALISSYDPNRLTAGGVRMTLARHMPYAQSSEKFAAPHWKNPTTALKFIYFSFFQCKEEEAHSLQICTSFKAYFNAAFINCDSLFIKHMESCWPPDSCVCIFIRWMCLCVCVCVLLYFMCWVCFFASVNLHNNVSCRDLMTAVVDFMFFSNSAWWLHSCIKLQQQLSQSVSSACRQGSTLSCYLLEVSSFDKLFYFSLFCFLEDKIENRDEICSIDRSHWAIFHNALIFLQSSHVSQKSCTTWRSHHA